MTTITKEDSKKEDSSISDQNTKETLMANDVWTQAVTENTIISGLLV